MRRAGKYALQIGLAQCEMFGQTTHQVGVWRNVVGAQLQAATERHAFGELRLAVAAGRRGQRMKPHGLRQHRRKTPMRQQNRAGIALVKAIAR